MAKKIKSFISVAISDFPIDTVRKDTGNYWVNGSHGQPVTPSEQRVNMTFETAQTFKTKDVPFFNTRQEIKIVGNSDYFTSEEEWMSYIKNNYMQHQTFDDFVFESEGLVSKNNIRPSSGGTAYGEIDFMYNFYVQAYEFMLSMPQIPENILPNIYAEISSDFPNVDPFFDNLITGFGITSKDEVKINNLAKQQRRPTPKLDQNKELYNRIAKKMARTGGFNRNKLQQRFSNIFFPMENLELLKDIESRMNFFPMATKIEFRTDSRTEFAQILKDSKLSSSFLKYISLLLRPTNNKKIQNLQTNWMPAPYISKIGFLNTPVKVSTQTPDEAGGDIWGEAKDKKARPGESVVNTVTREFNLFDWWEAFLGNKLVFPSSDQNEIFMGNQCQSVLTARDIQSSFAKILSLLVFSGKLQTLIKNKMRTYADIANGEKCYHEVAGYRIAKYINSVSQTPVQNIWIPNSNELDVVQYFDTQVKYDKEYTYVIYAYTVVIGSEYDYSDFKFISDIESENEGVNNISSVDTPILSQPSGQKGVRTDTALLEERPLPNISKPSPFYKSMNFTRGGRFTPSPAFNIDSTDMHLAYPQGSFDGDIIAGAKRAVYAENAVKDYTKLEARFVANVRPSVRVVEVPIYSRQGSIIDNPPVFPDSHIVPLKGIDNKIKINLNTHMGSYLLHPIILDQPGEQESINRLYKSKSLPDTSRLRYTTDDPVSQFEIYRTTVLPTKYTDFSSQLHTVVNTDVDASTLQDASSGAFVDNINPNVIYYYMFRSIDKHGNFSNPSPVFSVLMVSNDGIIFPLIEAIQMEAPQIPRKSSKAFKKMINIMPTMGQSIVNYSQTNLNEAATAKGSPVVLGVEDEALFGNTFKIRVTSKRTGKKIDFNVQFDVLNTTSERERK